MNPTSATHERSPWNPAAYAFSRAVLPEPAASETAELALLSAQWEGSDGDRTAVLAAVRTAVSERLASDHGPVEREDLERWLLAGEQAFLAAPPSAGGPVPDAAAELALDEGQAAPLPALDAPPNDDLAAIPELPARPDRSDEATAAALSGHDVPEEWLAALGVAPAATTAPEDLVSAAARSGATVAEPRQPVPEDWLRALEPTASAPALQPRRRTRPSGRFPGLFESAVDRSVGEWSRPKLRLALAASVVVLAAVAGIAVIASTFDVTPESGPVPSNKTVRPVGGEQLRATPTVEGGERNARARPRQRTPARGRTERSRRQRVRPTDAPAPSPARPAPVSPPQASPAPIRRTPTPSPDRPQQNVTRDPPPPPSPRTTPSTGDPVLEDPQPAPPADEPRRLPPPQS